MTKIINIQYKITKKSTKNKIYYQNKLLPLNKH